MKFNCTQASLLKALNTSIRAVSSRTTVPILKGVLISVHDGKAFFTASDLNFSIETFIDVSDSVDGSTVVNAKLLSDIIRKFPDSMVSLDNSLENGKLSVRCLGSDVSIAALAPEEFPKIKSLNDAASVVLDKEDIKDVINKCIFSASSDEKRGILTGCLFVLQNGSLEAVALDNYRMAVIKKKTDVVADKKVIIPAAVLSEVCKIFSEDSESKTVEMKFEDKKVEFRTSDTVIISRLLEGNFTDYHNLIPPNNYTKLIINREDLFNAIERASLFAKDPKNCFVKIQLCDNEIIVSSKSEDGYINDKVDAEISGNTLTIGFSIKYLTDVLKAVNDEEVCFSFGSNLTAALINPVDGDDYTYLILPVRIFG